MNLTMPKDGWDALDEAWDHLTQHLFTFLRQELAAGHWLDFRGLRDDLETWQPFMEQFDGDERAQQRRHHQWWTARRMLWCAEQAAQAETSDYDQINRLLLAIADVPPFIADHKAWAFDCIRSLRDADPPFRTVSVPVALADDRPSDTGIVCTLVLDVLHPGGGQVFQHPQDALTTSIAADFHTSMTDAWEQAKAHARKEGVTEPYDGHWRLLFENYPLKEATGRSASGAAARGWYFALTGKIPDKGLILLAQVDERDSQRLTIVDGIRAKVKAIAEDDKFQINTIVVTSHENRDEAHDALGSRASEITVELRDDGQG